MRPLHLSPALVFLICSTLVVPCPSLYAQVQHGSSPGSVSPSPFIPERPNAVLPNVPANPTQLQAAPYHYKFNLSQPEIDSLKSIPLPVDKGGGKPVNAPAQSAANSLPLLPSASTSFVGLANTGWVPPDGGIAAGNNYVIETVNESIAIYDKSGNLQYSTLFQTWFGVSSSASVFDPRIYYDPVGQRFIFLATTSTSSTSSYLLSVSQTSDPLGSWYIYNLDATLDGSTSSTNWADYPALGFDSTGIFITSNQFSFRSNHFQYAKIRVLRKAAVYQGASISWYDFWGMSDNGSATFSLKPAVTYSAANGEYLLDTQPDTGSSVALWLITYQPPASPNLALQGYVTIGSYAMPPDAAQLDGSNLLNTGDARMQQVQFRDGYLFSSFTEGHNWGSGTVAAIRLLKIDVSTDQAVKDITYGSDGVSYFYPAVSTDSHGNTVVVFNRSSASEYCGVWGGENLSPDSASVLLKAGEAYYGGSRWGDYNAVSPDPDGSRIWTEAEYPVLSGKSGGWSTWIASLVPGSDVSLAAQITSWEAVDTLGGVNLQWTTSSEVDNLGFNVLRSEETKGSYVMLSSYTSNRDLRGLGTNTSGKTYSYQDNSVLRGNSYSYIIQEISKDGSTKDSNPITIEVSDLPASFHLDQNYPNPFNPTTTINYQLPIASFVSLKVIDVLGRDVRTLVNKRQTAGTHSVSFDGSSLPSGVYFYRLESGGYVMTKKLMLIK